MNQRRRHFNVSKAGFVTQLGNDEPRRIREMRCWMSRSRRTSRTLAICLLALGDGQSLGDFSLTIVVYALYVPQATTAINPGLLPVSGASRVVGSSSIPDCSAAVSLTSSLIAPTELPIHSRAGEDVLQGTCNLFGSLTVVLSLSRRADITQEATNEVCTDG